MDTTLFSTSSKRRTATTSKLESFDDWLSNVSVQQQKSTQRSQWLVNSLKNTSSFKIYSISFKIYSIPPKQSRFILIIYEKKNLAFLSFLSLPFQFVR